MRYFFVEQPVQTGSTCTITGSDARHIRNVLRLKPGDPVFLFDGKGFEYEAKIVRLSVKSVGVSVIKQFPSAIEPSVQIAVAQAFLKTKKMDGLVRPLTELGITKWIPFISERSIARPDRKRLSIRTDRWRKIAKESLKQCRRARPLEIAETVSFAKVLDLGRSSDVKFIFWENESRSLQLALSQSPDKNIKKVFLILGPEGGLSKAEVESAQKNGFFSVTLGPRILKSETAAVAASTLMQYLFGDLGQKNLDKNPGL
jgi:16S rRNA (uracil1498-N3)-methyltransferase